MTSPAGMHADALNALYRRLLAAYGAQSWWPAESRFEILVGAVLTQNTAWTNVERALSNLRARDLLDAHAILKEPKRKLAVTIRPAGCFNVKAGRLRNLCRWFVDAGGFRALDSFGTGALREQLLAVNGVGPETADDILLYAFHRPVFVIDAYTRRLLTRLGWLSDRPGYESLRARMENALKPDVVQFQQYHALIVEHGKRVCRSRPLCEACSVGAHCRSFRMGIDACAAPV